MSITVVLVAPQPHLDALHDLLEVKGIRLLEGVLAGREGLSRIAELSPDVVVVALPLGDEMSIEGFIHKARELGPQVVATTFTPLEIIDEVNAMHAGAAELLIGPRVSGLAAAVGRAANRSLDTESFTAV